MAAPNLQAEGAIAAVTSASVTPVLPAHQAGDILVCSVANWAPNTVADMGFGADPSGWAIIPGSADADTNGVVALYWKRATSGAESNPTFTHINDTGSDTCFAARAYVIRGCVTTGNPWDAVSHAMYTAPNSVMLAVTVSGTERMVVQFVQSLDNQAMGAAPSGWTAGTAVTTATGTDAGFQTFRKDNVSASTTNTASAVSAPAQGFYTFAGVSFKPVVSGVFLAAALAVTCGLSPSLTDGKPLAAQLDVVAGLSSDLLVPTSALLAASLAATASLTPVLRDAKPLVAQLDVTAGLASVLRDGKPLAAQLDFSSSLVGALRDEHLLAAQLASAFGLAPTLLDQKRLAAVLAASSALSGTLPQSSAALLAAQLAAISGLSSDLRDEKRLAAQLDAAFAITPSLLRVQGLQAQLAASSQLSADARVQHLLAAVLAMQSSTDARLTAGAFLGVVGRRLLFGIGR